MKIEKETLCRLYVEEELNQVEIGEIFSCDRKNIDYYLKKYEIPKRSRKESMRITRAKKNPFTLTIEEVIADLENGLLLKDIQEKHNISRSALYNLTKANGLNFSNHEMQTALQSERLKENNPVPRGRKRDLKLLEPAKIAKKKLYEQRKKEVEEKGDYKEYCKMARNAAYFLYGRKTPEGLEIDHLYSVKDGYKNNVPIDVISHPSNLRLITQAENKRKSHKSIITLEQLYRITK